jgi:hypothetical protein
MTWSAVAVAGLVFPLTLATAESVRELASYPAPTWPRLQRHPRLEKGRVA